MSEYPRMVIRITRCNSESAESTLLPWEYGSEIRIRRKLIYLNPNLKGLLPPFNHLLPPFNRPPPFVPSTARQNRNEWARSCATSSGYRHSRHSCQHGRPIRYCRKCKSTDNQQTYPSLFQQQRDLMNQVLRMIYDIFGIRISATVLEDFILRQRRY